MVVVAGCAVVLGCGGASSGGAAPPPATGAAPPAAPQGGEEVDAETAAEIFARLRADLVACYEQGRKAVPTMTSGKVTINAGIDREGRASCVVPSDDTGLTQDVEDCMRARVARESFKSNGGTWSTELPLVVRDGALSLVEASGAPAAMETVETHGLPDAAVDVVEALLPKLHQCTQGTEGTDGLRVVHVGARIGKDGRVECALASSASHVPTRVRECAAEVMSSATFPAPRSSVGLVSVPVKVLARQ